MTQRDRNRVVVLKQAQKKQITQSQAAKELDVSERQVRRLLVRHLHPNLERPRKTLRRHWPAAAASSYPLESLQLDRKTLIPWKLATVYARSS